MHKHITTGGAALLGLMLLAGGCGKASEKTAEKMAEAAIQAQGGGDAKVDLSEGKYSVQTKDGTFEVAAGGGAKLPDGFPADIHVVKNAKVLMSAATGDGFMVNLESAESMDTLDAAYTKEMKAQGWTVEATMNLGEQRSLVFKKGSRQTSVTLGKGPQGTQVIIGVSGK